MVSHSPLLKQAARSVTAPSVAPPDAKSVVEALLNAEKLAKKQKTQYAFEQLIGSWRLCVITGTKKTRQTGVVLGAGRYVPRWVEIQLSYSHSEQIETETVENVVRLGTLRMSLSGPVKFLSPKNILAFDFTRLNIQLFGASLYQGGIRGGQAKEDAFYGEIKNQAFFAYFLVEDDIIAARGRGGGLALWGRQI